MVISSASFMTFTVYLSALPESVWCVLDSRGLLDCNDNTHIVISSSSWIKDDKNSLSFTTIVQCRSRGGVLDLRGLLDCDDHTHIVISSSSFMTFIVYLSSTTLYICTPRLSAFRWQGFHRCLLCKIPPVQAGVTHLYSVKVDIFPACTIPPRENAAVHTPLTHESKLLYCELISSLITVRLGPIVLCSQL